MHQKHQTLRGRGGAQCIHVSSLLQIRLTSKRRGVPPSAGAGAACPPSRQRQQDLQQRRGDHNHTHPHSHSQERRRPEGLVQLANKSDSRFTHLPDQQAEDAQHGSRAADEKAPPCETKAEHGCSVGQRSGGHRPEQCGAARTGSQPASQAGGRAGRGGGRTCGPAMMPAPVSPVLSIDVSCHATR